jgi:hypothetical protein
VLSQAAQPSSLMSSSWASRTGRRSQRLSCRSFRYDCHAGLASLEERGVVRFDGDFNEESHHGSLCENHSIGNPGIVTSTSRIQLNYNNTTTPYTNNPQYDHCAQIRPNASFRNASVRRRLSVRFSAYKSNSELQHQERYSRKLRMTCLADLVSFIYQRSASVERITGGWRPLTGVEDSLDATARVLDPFS